MDEDRWRSEGEARKARSIARLQSEGVPTIDHLPWIECDPGTLQPTDAIARRGTVLALLAVYAEPNGMPLEVVQGHLDQRGLRDALTVREQSFLTSPIPSDADRGPFTWQYESANVLLWALGYVDSLRGPSRYCTARAISGLIAPRTVADLVRDARPRTAAEVFDEAGLIFRYHWAARNAVLRGQPPPAGLVPPVCFYRHKALNWLTHSSTDWDDVDTST